MTPQDIAKWIEEGSETPVALSLYQKLAPVNEDGVIFPPTYAGNPPYVIDTLADGTQVALIDSVGSQANRMEPIFKEPPYAALVPQITIKAGNHRPISIFEVGHRVADALVRSSRPLADLVVKAFDALAEGNAEPMARLAPTSLVFGVWDSRGAGMKVPRLINSVIRANDVSELKRSAQYIPPIMPEDYAKLIGEDEKALDKVAEAGFVHVPSTGDPGGVIARSDIYRSATVNLVALRKLGGDDAERLRKYILGLTLVAATWPQDGYLRQGCLLVAAEQGAWKAVYRDGRREAIDLTHDDALAFARQAAEEFGVGDDLEAEFDSRLAREVLKKAKKS